LMLRLMVVTSVLIPLAGSAAHALKECPVSAADRDAVIKAIQQAPTCKASFDILDVCRGNAGGDVELAGLVTERCEKTFLPTIKATHKRIYDEAHAACQRKYAKSQGTMYASAQAICEAKAAVRFAK